MNALSEGLVNVLIREGWLISWGCWQNERGERLYQAVAQRGDERLCAEGRAVTETFARLWRLCNRGNKAETWDTMSRSDSGN